MEDFDSTSLWESSDSVVSSKDLLYDFDLPFSLRVCTCGGSGENAAVWLIKIPCCKAVYSFQG